MDDVTLAVGYGLHLCRCPHCASAMVVVDPSAEELRQINDWLDTQMLYDPEHWRGTMTPHIH